MHLVEKRPYAFAECRIVVSSYALCGVARADRKTSRGGRGRERSVRQVCDESVDKVFVASSVGGPSLTESPMMRFLKPIDFGTYLDHELTKAFASGNDPLPNPLMPLRGLSSIWAF